MKKMIIYSTCQGGPVSGLLRRSKTFNDEFDLVYYSNFSRPGEVDFSIKENELRECSVFLYHPIRNKGDGFSTDQILGRLPDNAQAHVLPYVTFSAYWPDFSRVPAQGLGISDDFPYGRIPYRATRLDSIVNARGSEQAFTEFINMSDAEAYERANQALDSDIAYLTGLDVLGPMKVKDFILQNFRDRQLFYIFNHPKVEIYRHLVDQLLVYLGHAPLEDSMVIGFVGHKEQNMPIHPATGRALGLKFVSEAANYSYLGESFTFESFMRRYLDYIAELRNDTVGFDRNNRP